jgi:outer membrane lipoprotein-sorting protein
MNKALRWGIVSTAVAIMLFVTSTSDVKAQGVLREILNRMDSHYKSLTSLKADVTMVKTDVTLGESDTYNGSTSLLPKTVKRPQYIRLDWIKPSEEHLVVIGDAYQVWKVSAKQVITGKVDKAKNSGAAGSAFAFMGMSKAELQANYEVNYIGQETAAGAKTWHIELIPKTKDKYKAAELWVDGNGMPLQAKIVAPNNDLTTVVLTNIQKNVTIKADQFRLDYDKKVVKEIKA